MHVHPDDPQIQQGTPLYLSLAFHQALKSAMPPRRGAVAPHLRGPPTVLRSAVWHQTPEPGLTLQVSRADVGVHENQGARVNRRGRENETAGHLMSVLFDFQAFSQRVAWVFFLPWTLRVAVVGACGKLSMNFWVS